jgi:glucokinase
VAAAAERGPASGVVVGVDLGGTKLSAALSDLAGTVLRERTVPTDPRGGRVVIGQITGLARELLAEQGGAGPLRALALGSPGALDRRTGAMAFAPNIPSFGDLDVAKEIAAELGTDVVLDNDVNTAALGEQWAGHGRGLADFVFLSVGTGIGMGVVIGGVLRTGANGAAGEIACLPLGADPFDRANQVRGALEEAVGDAAAAAALDEEARLIALAVHSVTAVLDPGLAVLGGGIGSRAELLEPVRSWLGRLTERPVPLVVSQLGHRAGLLGAVALAVRAAGDGAVVRSRARC